MKKILILIAAVVFAATGVFAQRDSRNRLPETVVADALARMPLQSHADFVTTMSELAAIPGVSVKMLADYMAPYGTKESNAKYEYALSGLVDYCVARRDTALASQLNAELAKAALQQSDSLNRRFLNSLAGRVNFKAAESAAVKAAGAPVFDKSMCKKAVKTLMKGDSFQRNAALDNIAACGRADEFVGEVQRVYNRLPKEAKADLIRWIGDNHVESGEPIASSLNNLQDSPEVAEASIEMASKFVSPASSMLLEKALYTPYGDKAARAMRFYRGDVSEIGLRVMESGDATAVANLVTMAEKRRVPALFEPIRKYAVAQTDPALNEAAYKAMANCASSADFDVLCSMLDSDGGENVGYLSDGISNAMGDADSSRQYEMLAPVVEKAARPANFYTLLACSNSGRAMHLLEDAYNKGENRDAAFFSLLLVNRPEMPEVLYKIAANDSERRDMAAGRICDLVGKSSAEPAAKSFQLRRLLQMNLTDATRNDVIAGLGNTATNSALSAVAPWLDNETTARKAAAAVKNIVAKNKSLQGHESTNRLLEKAKAIYAAQTNNADAGYAVDEINLLMQKTAPVAATLTKEEAEQGFELLFDGLTLNNWHGNTLNYTPENGCIYVTAGYGSEGNLYTDKDYSDFVFRFDFQFLEPGVNNGVGIRTTAEGMDAAYHGMEIQILDHDAPIYKGLRPYQQHGAVYGIIVPEHVDFGPVGTWHSEEIRAVGDRITVTVDGKVILDGDIRKACKGHNIAPDGGDKNPYTVDHQNHPGLFNKSGKISFCGHGEGLNIKNVRILDLAKK